MDKIATLLHVTIAIILTTLYSTETELKNEIFYSAILMYVLMIIVARTQHMDIEEIKKDKI